MVNSPTSSTTSSSASVSVAIRVRPMSAQEKQQGGNNKEFIHYIPNEPQIVAGQQHSYTFDHVFQPFTNQHTIYETSIYH
ncbi:unnamed protein product [Cunninghamella blakesleeana]